MNGYLLDTHIWIWIQTNNTSYLHDLTPQETARWQRQGRLFLSAASVWELGVAYARGRVDLGTSIDQWIDTAMEDGGIQLLQLSTRVLLESTRLPATFHRDPGDRMLVATARDHDLTLVTRDERILRYGKEGYVKVLAR